MSSYRTLTSAFVLLPTLVLGSLVACGSAVDRGEVVPDGASSGSSGGASGSSGSTGTSGFGASSSSSSGASGTTTCAAAVAQTAKAKVDIIFVIDDSGSMTGEMSQIRTNVNTFASKIGSIGLDYTVTFIVKKGTQASGNQICVPPPLGGANCADNPPLFHHVDYDVQSTDSFEIILGTYDNAWPPPAFPFLPARKNTPTPWKPYLRTDSTKVFIEVTDDTSDISETAFDTALLAKTPAGMFGTATDRHYIFHSIVSKPFAAAPPTTAQCSSAAGPSEQYQKLSILTHGIIDEVCKTDYSGVLNNIAKGITDKLGCELGYPSTATSDPTKLAVTFTPKGKAAQTLTQVTDVSKCGTIANAWYYDNAANPTKIILCPSMCTQANASTDGKLEALVGCKGAPPK